MGGKYDGLRLSDAMVVRGGALVLEEAASGTVDGEASGSGGVIRVRLLDPVLFGSKHAPGATYTVAGV